MFCPCFVIQYFVIVLFCNHFEGDDKAGCFAIPVFMMSSNSKCSLAVPRSVMGWSAACDRGIS